MNYNFWLNYASDKLAKFKYSKSDAEVLLKHVTKKDLAYILTFMETELTKNQELDLIFFLNRRCKGEPIAYILEEKEFWSLLLKVSPVTLIPRFDTEFLVEVALEFLLRGKFFKILDLGTGTGAIALSLASESSNFFILGIDINDSIVSLANYNAKKLSIDNVIFYKSNWFNSVIKQKFDMIISNPPYISIEDFNFISRDVFFEPKLALLSKNNGLADIEWIINHSRNFLSNNGWLILEHGFLQAKKVRKIFIDYNYQEILTFQDYGGCDRVSVGRWKN